jgi:hypothetical protein
MLGKILPHEIVKAPKSGLERRNPLGNVPQNLHSRGEAGAKPREKSTELGANMIKRKVVIAGVALGVLCAFAVVSQPVQAAGCVVVSAKARGVSELHASQRAQAKLMRHIDRWAHKNKLTTVRSGHAPTHCSKGGALFVCTADAKVCP